MTLRTDLEASKAEVRQALFEIWAKLMQRGINEVSACNIIYQALWDVRGEINEAAK